MGLNSIILLEYLVFGTFGGHTWQYSGVTLGSVLTSGDQTQVSCVLRQAPYLLDYLSRPSNVLKYSRLKKHLEVNEVAWQWSTAFYV